MPETVYSINNKEFESTKLNDALHKALLQLWETMHFTSLNMTFDTVDFKGVVVKTRSLI